MSIDASGRQSRKSILEYSFTLNSKGNLKVKYLFSGELCLLWLFNLSLSSCKWSFSIFWWLILLLTGAPYSLHISQTSCSVIPRHAPPCAQAQAQAQVAQSHLSCLGVDSLALPLLGDRIGRAPSSSHSRTWLWKAWVINKQESLKCNAPSEPLPPTNQNSLSSVSEVDCNSSSKPTSAIVLR